MYKNRVNLIGFLGKDAETKTASNNQPYTVLSLATKESWKKDGEWQSRTEWHRIIVWGNATSFAKNLQKGTHLDVEGSIRTREYTEIVGTGKKKAEIKRRVFEVVAKQLLKLDPSTNLDEGGTREERAEEPEIRGDHEISE